MEKLLLQLQSSEEEKQQLFKKNENLANTNEDLNKQITLLQAEVARLKEDTHKESESKAINALRKVFTSGQISILMSETSKRVRWSSEDIMSAISLRSLSPKAYKYLRDVQKIPLPSLTTLQNWISTFNIAPGILKDVFKIMAKKGHDLSLHEKITVLTFDDVYISNKLDIDRKQQKVYGSHKTCLVVMARGLFKNYMK